MLALLPVLWASPQETAAQVYESSQRVLDAMPQVLVAWMTGTGDHGVFYGYARPNKGYHYREMGGDFSFRCDGKRVATDRDGIVTNRPYHQGDLEAIGLLGLESFYHPKTPPKPIGEVYKMGDGKTLALLMATSKGREFLFIDSATRLPIGTSNDHEDEIPTGIQQPYYIGTKLEENEMHVAAPLPAKEVYLAMQKKLARYSGIDFRFLSPKSNAWIMALRPNRFRKAGDGKVVVADGKHLLQRSKMGKVTSKPQKGWAPEFFPGLEGFFGYKSAPKVSGTAEVVVYGGQESYAFRAAYPGRNEYTLYTDVAFNPIGYAVLNGHQRGLACSYDLFEEAIGLDPRLFVLDPPDPMNLPSLPARNKGR